MSIFSLLSFGAGIIYIFLGLYVLRLDVRSRTNRLFFFLSLFVALWAFPYAFVYSAESKPTLWVWFRLSALGWCNIGGITLHFLLSLTRKEKILKKWWLYPLLYLFGLVLTFRAWTGVITAKDFIRTPLGWVEVVATESPWFWAHLLNYCILVLLGTFITWQWGKRTERAAERKQARIIVTAILATLILGTLINVALPALKMSSIPAIAPIIVLIWGWGIWYAIIRYRLMVLTPPIASGEIISRMQDLVFLLDPHGTILKVNPQVERILGRREQDLVGKSISTLLPEKEWKNILTSLGPGNSQPPNREIDLLDENGQEVPVALSTSLVLDRAQDPLGVVAVAQDLRPLKRLQAEIEVRKQTEEKLKEIRDELEIKVEERTTELARTNQELKKEISEREQYEQALKKSEEALKALSLVDELTGLYNRRGFMTLADQEMKIAHRMKRRLYFLFADLDGLKEINDRFGHMEGDQALTDTAQVFRETFREPDIIARLGGDEFVVLALEVRQEVRENILVERLENRLTAFQHKKNRPYHFSVSIGTAAFNPQSPDSLEALLSLADQRMYQAKREKRQLIG